jgi:uroporphyrinogen III methyltransferase/synthase
VIGQQTVQVTDPPDWGPVDVALDQLEQFDWLVFCSRQAVSFFLKRLFARGGDLRRLGRVQVAAVGPGTARWLTRCLVRADLGSSSQLLAQALAGEAEGRRFLLVCHGRHAMAHTLAQAGARVEKLAVYDRVAVGVPNPDVAKALSAHEMDWVAVAGPTAARSLAGLYGDALLQTQFASIGPRTSAALRQLGYEPSVEASPHTAAGLAEAMCRHVATQNLQEPSKENT